MPDPRIKRAPSLCLVLPYFGPLPNYFPLWLESCRQNCDVNWLLFVDQKDPLDTPTNVTVIRTSFDEVRTRVQSIFDFPISLDHPYKLCDYKPSYGEVFERELATFDFWGFCDLDTIWGNLRKFLTREMLYNYDRIFGGGHLSVFRNAGEVNEVYRQGGTDGTLSYRDVFASSQSFAFDEWGPEENGLNQIFSNQGRRFHLATMPYADVKVRQYGLRTNRDGFTLDPGVAELERRKRHIAYTYSEGSLRQHAIDGESGQLISQEEAYIHLQKRPMLLHSGIDPKSGFAILPPNRFQPLPSEVDAKYLRKCAPERRFYLHNYRIRTRNLRSKLLERLRYRV